MSSSRRLAIIGISGRMGSEIRSISSDPRNDFNFRVTGGVSHSGANLGSDVRVVKTVADLDKSQTDVVIDFSLPEATRSVIDWCVATNTPLVSGVTGVRDEHKAMFAEAGQKLPLLWAPNMSLGVAVMARMLAEFSKLEGFDFQIEELHHNRKKDRPSGTAIFLQDRLKEAVSVPVPEPLAIRGGGIFGIHRAWAMGEEEMITLEHTAMNRRVFARGALRAAAWILDKKPGLYRMDDVLGR